MEEKLFWIGVLVGAHYFLSRYFIKKDSFKNAKFTRIWHALFMAVIFFSAAVLLIVTLDNKKGDVVTASLFTERQLIYGILAAAAGYLWAFLKFKRPAPGNKGTLHPAVKNDLEWSETIYSALILAAVVMYCAVQAFKIPSGSMRTTFLEGDHLFVNKFIYGIRIPFTGKKVLKFRDIRRQDIIVFRFPSENPEEIQCGGKQYGKDFIKRVIGLPGDTIELKDGQPLINGIPVGNEKYVQFLDGMRYPYPPNRLSGDEYQKLWETGTLGRIISDYVRDNFGPVKIPEGHYLVMGDNRDRSCDSRYWGPVPDRFVKGRAWFTYWPPNRMAFPE